MSVGRYRAWRFVPPQTLVAGAERAWPSAGLQLDATGRIEMVDEDASVRQAILLLVSTSPGERIMRPDYGCSLARLLYAVNDDTTAGLAIHYVRSALERWEPRIEVVTIDAQRDPELPERLIIILDYRVRATQRITQLRLPFDLQTGQS